MLIFEGWALGNGEVDPEDEADANPDGRVVRVLIIDDEAEVSAIDVMGLVLTDKGNEENADPDEMVKIAVVDGKIGSEITLGRGDGNPENVSQYRESNVKPYWRIYPQPIRPPAYYLLNRTQDRRIAEQQCSMNCCRCK